MEVNAVGRKLIFGLASKTSEVLLIQSLNENHTSKKDDLKYGNSVVTVTKSFIPFDFVFSNKLKMRKGNKFSHQKFNLCQLHFLQMNDQHFIL